MDTRSSRHPARLRTLTTAVCLLSMVFQGMVSRLGADEPAPPLAPPQVIHRITSPNETLQMIVNSSRILALDRKVPRIGIDNPDILAVNPLAPNQVQIFAKKAGVTLVNLWTENNELYTVSVVVTGDIQELKLVLNRLVPTARLEFLPLPNSLVISGFVDDQSQISHIIAVAQNYSASVINAIHVGGVQQVQLNVRVMEISRTKLRNLGVDWAAVAGGGSFVASGVTGFLRMAGLPTRTVATTGGETFSFGIVNPNTGDSFFAFLEALRQDDIAKILAEPNLVTVSGRPSYFNAGGEFPILVPQSLGTVSIQYRPYGTQVDFVPIVLGNGNIRLEVRPRVSEIDSSRSVVINNINVPALKTREIDTGVEMRAGQTLAIAGLVQNREEATKRGLPLLSDLPYIGTAFRKVRVQTNEIELLILVTPQFVDALDPHEVPQCGPGMSTTYPTDLQLYFKGHLEAPKVGPGGGGLDEELPPPGLEQPGVPQGRSPGEPVPPPQPMSRSRSKPPARPADQTVSRPQPGAGRSETAATIRAPITGLAQAPRYNRTEPSSRTNPASPQAGAVPKTSSTPGFIGPLGYDVLK